MSFIERVRARTNQPQTYRTFKNLLTAYRFAEHAQVIFPQVYLDFPVTGEFNWQEISSNLPNIFVVRPSVFVNTHFDYFLRDDNINGVMNYTLRKQYSHSEAFQEQVDNVVKVDKTASLLFEEFPLTGDTLEYPTLYKVHTFYGEIAFIQVTTQTDNFWVDNNGNPLDNNSNNDIHYNYEDLRSAAKALSIQTIQPYIRIDFVASTRGPMFRSFACTPGDIRSSDHNEFYRTRDQSLEQLWKNAEERIKRDNRIPSKENANSTESKPSPPNDNS